MTMASVLFLLIHSIQDVFKNLLCELGKSPHAVHEGAAE